MARTAQMKTLHDVFVNELRDIYDGELRITKALPRLVAKATTDGLRTALETHLGQTEQQIERLKRAFSMLNLKPSGTKCDGIAGILHEGEKHLKDEADGPVRDAAMIAAAQKVEHYETAAYGSLVEWAREMGHNDVADLLEQTLEEEKAADLKLTQLATGGINQTAASAAAAPA